MGDTDEQDDEEQTFFQAHKTWIILAGVALLGGGGYLGLRGHHEAPLPRTERLTMITLPPPPPPKPIATPPPLQQPPEPKPETQKDRMEDAPKAEAPKPEPPKAPDEPPPTMGSNIKGDGPDSFGLAGSGNGNRIGGIGGNGSGGGSPYSRYGAQIQNRVAEALRQDKRTRAAAFSGRIRLWFDPSGTVTRAEPTSRGDTGTEMAAAVIVGQRIFDRLPDGMPMPVTVHPSASRPR